MVDLRLKFPPHFFDEEERCGHFVTCQTKELWAVLLDLFSEFDRVCKKHGIIYYANAGTMLGAVRHKGFIPWDDDLDLIMFRDQYDQLCEIASAEFRHPYFFQTENTDFGHLRGHAQLRNSETTGMLEWEVGRNYTYNQGIFIDIFVLDSVIDNPLLFAEQKERAVKFRDKGRRWAFWTPQRFEPDPSFIKNTIKKIVGFVLQGYFRKMADRQFGLFDAECKKYSHIDTEQVSILTFDFENTKLYKRRDDYRHFVMMDFEFLKIPVISGYDNELRTQYGDYMTFVRGSNFHGGLVIDTSIPYYKYKSNTKCKH